MYRDSADCKRQDWKIFPLSSAKGFLNAETDVFPVVSLGTRMVCLLVSNPFHMNPEISRWRFHANAEPAAHDVWRRAINSSSDDATGPSRVKEAPSNAEEHE